MSLRIVHITDPHLLNPAEELMGLDVNTRLEAVLSAAAAFEPDAYFLTGDFCAHEPVMEVYHRLRVRLDVIGAPYYLVPGNHDDRQMMRNAFFLPGHGQGPMHCLVRVKGRNFIFLDSSPGYVDEEQTDWLAHALDQYPAADIVIHHPPVPMGVVFMDEQYPLRNAEKLVSLLTADGLRRRVFCGHYHSERSVCYRNLDIHIGPPTSFYIDPEAGDFQQEFHPAGFQLLEWTQGGDFRLVVRGV